MAGKGRAQGGMSGGARPGAGAKKQDARAEQETRRSIVLDVFSPEEWRTTVTGWMQTARETRNYGLLFPLLPYLMGSPKQEINVSGQIEHVQLEAAQQVLRVIGGTEKRAS
jgi:hypothetical protein